MIETYCDACGARIEGVHESDVMVYFQYTPETYIDRLYHFCPTCSVNMREELRLMQETADKMKMGKHGACRKETGNVG